jgi:ribonuclease P protein component
VSKSNLKKSKNKSKLQDIFDQGAKFVCSNFIALFLHADAHNSSYTVIASKKIGNAVIRNRAKRRLREITRLYIKPLSPLRMIFIARNATAASSYDFLKQDVLNLLKNTKQFKR